MHFIIIGGGLSGLAAATTVYQNGHTFQLLEKGNALGGRVQTSKVNGHLIDHGFQVYLPHYEEGKRFFDYGSLDFKPFAPGAMILYNEGNYDTIGDPLRRPATALSTLFSKVGSFRDKQRLLKLRKKAYKYCQNPSAVDTSMSTLDYLKNFGFKDEMINNFFVPFFSGVFFDQKLETSSAMFLFLYNKFASSLASIPSKGMGELANQLAAGLPQENIHLQTEVKSIGKKSVQVVGGSNYLGDKIIFAAPDQKLLNGSENSTQWRSSHTLYFEAPQSPHDKKLVGIVAKKKTIVNNLSVLSNISASYAPDNKHQIAVSIFGSVFSSAIEEQIKSECKSWFGNQVDKWELIDKHLIYKALPDQKHVNFHFDKATCKKGDKIYCAGDSMLNGSIDAALKSGRLAAEYAMQD
jgi:phytoene dehydrogenase-like protein